MTTEQIKDKLNTIIFDLLKLQEETWTKDWNWQQFHKLHAAIENLSDLDESLEESESKTA